MLAIIGGSGATQLSNLVISHRQVIRTPYGEPSGALTFGTLDKQPVVFLARHGYGHTLAPHEINYRANLWALHAQGVTRVVALATVGGIRADLTPGTLVIPEQIIDYTWGRKFTYFEGSDKPVVHVDFTRPYCDKLRALCLAAAQQCGITVVDGGVYAATQGPRLETAAEINRLARDGADVVGMTAMPEAALARELGMSYAAITLVANAAAGRGESEQQINLQTITQVMEQAMPNIRQLLGAIVTLDHAQTRCTFAQTAST